MAGNLWSLIFFSRFDNRLNHGQVDNAAYREPHLVPSRVSSSDLASATHVSEAIFTRS